ncbi:hypothetical protein BDW75DRAFT_197506 [Aspergillus navahoensis]
MTLLFVLPVLPATASTVTLLHLLTLHARLSIPRTQTNSLRLASSITVDTGGVSLTGNQLQDCLGYSSVYSMH